MFRHQPEEGYLWCSVLPGDWGRVGESPPTHPRHRLDLPLVADKPPGL